MSTLYPAVPSLPVHHNWPHAIFSGPNGGYSFCPVCNAKWVCDRNLGGVINWEDDVEDCDRDDAQVLPYPHIAFDCGGVLRDLGYGYWGGKCWATKTQLTLQLTEETE